jgi:hypothetical protein
MRRAVWKARSAGFRRNHFVPVPQIESIAELNAMIDKWDADDLDRRVGSPVHDAWWQRPARLTATLPAPAN